MHLLYYTTYPSTLSKCGILQGVHIRIYIFVKAVFVRTGMTKGPTGDLLPHPSPLHPPALPVHKGLASCSRRQAACSLHWASLNLPPASNIVESMPSRGRRGTSHTPPVSQTPEPALKPQMPVLYYPPQLHSPGAAWAEVLCASPIQPGASFSTYFCHLLPACHSDTQARVLL